MLLMGLGPRLQDKVVMLSGGGGAIGRTIALTLAMHGAFVSVGDLDGKSAEETVSFVHHQLQSLKSTSSHTLNNVSSSNKPSQMDARLVPRRVDISNEEDVKAWVAEVKRTWGRVDVLVNKYV